MHVHDRSDGREQDGKDDSGSHGVLGLTEQTSQRFKIYSFDGESTRGVGTIETCSAPGDGELIRQCPQNVLGD